MLVRRLGAILQALQQLIGIPFLGVVVLDVPGGLVVDGHEPVRVLGLRKDQADEALVGLVAEHVHDGRAFLRRHETVAGRQRELRLVFELHAVRAVHHRSHRCFPGGLGRGVAFGFGVLCERGG